jgi:hypothetical protein
MTKCIKYITELHRNEIYFVLLPFDATQSFVQAGGVISMTGYSPGILS